MGSIGTTLMSITSITLMPTAQISLPLEFA